jgi:hypothetical protein
MQRLSTQGDGTAASDQSSFVALLSRGGKAAAWRQRMPMQVNIAVT